MLEWVFLIVYIYIYIYIYIYKPSLVQRFEVTSSKSLNKTGQYFFLSWFFITFIDIYTGLQDNGEDLPFPPTHRHLVTEMSSAYF